MRFQLFALYRRLKPRAFSCLYGTVAAILFQKFPEDIKEKTRVYDCTCFRACTVHELLVALVKAAD
jgi:hypothetical protein